MTTRQFARSHDSSIIILTRMMRAFRNGEDGLRSEIAPDFNGLKCHARRTAGPYFLD